MKELICCDFRQKPREELLDCNLDFEKPGQQRAEHLLKFFVLMNCGNKSFQPLLQLLSTFYDKSKSSFREATFFLKGNSLLASSSDCLGKKLKPLRRRRGRGGENEEEERRQERRRRRKRRRASCG